MTWRVIEEQDARTGSGVVMVRRQLVSGDEAVPAVRQHTQPCSDCPWSRRSLPGWTGSLSPKIWVGIAHSEYQVECHCYSGAQCAGVAIYRANVCKKMRSVDIMELPRDKEEVFATPSEFLKHHKENQK